MINKQNLWFLTLFSVILVLSVYYITMPSDLLKTNNGLYTNEEENTEVTINESDLIVAMRVSKEEERNELKTSLEQLLTNSSSTTEEKNEAYEKLQTLQKVSTIETKIEDRIKKEHNIESFVEISNNQASICAISKIHDTKLANSIMKIVQEEYGSKIYTTIRFEE